MPPPARRPLDPPPGDLPELPRPRLQLAMPLARDAEVRRGQDPAARVGDRRGQRPLVRVDPDHVARMIGRHQQMRRSRTAPLRSFHACPEPPRRYVVDGGSADNIPVGAPQRGERSYQVRPILEGKNRGRHFVRKTPSPGSQIAFESGLGSAFEPTPAVARADSTSEHRDRFARRGRPELTIPLATSVCPDRPKPPGRAMVGIAIGLDRRHDRFCLRAPLSARLVRHALRRRVAGGQTTGWPGWCASRTTRGRRRTPRRCFCRASRCWFATIAIARPWANAVVVRRAKQSSRAVRNATTLRPIGENGSHRI